MRVILVIGFILLAGFSISGCANVDHSVRIDTDGTNRNAVGSYNDNRSDPYGPRALGEGNPVQFARAVAMINYSKRLRNITYNEMGEVVGYEFDNAPYAGKSGAPQIQRQPNLPTSFGHQPIQ